MTRENGLKQRARSETPRVVVIGMGEVGRPLFEILSRAYPCIAVDLSPVEIRKPCSVLHVCYPFQIRRFVDVTAGYISKYQPELAIINSTIEPGTARQIQALVSQPVVYSPVRGKHVRMETDLLRYKKFVAGFTTDAVHKAANHFSKAGFSTDIFRSPEIAEFSKLIETTWLGVLVAWAQEVQRMAAHYGATYQEVNHFIEEIDFLPGHIFPGHIGGHCVLPNIEILRRQVPSNWLEMIIESNNNKREELEAAAPRDMQGCSRSDESVQVTGEQT